MMKLASFAFLGLFFVNTSFAAPAEITIKIFSESQIKRLLGPYPAPGSVESAQDFATLLDFQNTRTEAQCAEAAKEDSVTLKSLFGGAHGPLSRNEVRWLTVYLAKAYAEAGINIHKAKNVFKRPRPYIFNASIVPCVPHEDSYAYPSGHTTLARVLARILSKMYPERAQAFMKRADEIANNRVIGGVHHPSDIESGKKFGDLIANSIDY